MRLICLLRCILAARLIPWLFALPSSFAPEILQPLTSIVPPHCTKTAVIKSMLSHASGDDMIRTTQINIRIGLQNTACFRLENNSNERDSLFIDVLNAKSHDQGWLHTLTLSQLEHHHPISQQYEFAIPEVRTSCICECNVNSDVCSARTYSFTHCAYSNNNTQSLQENCFRTFHPNQADTGCLPGSQSKLCCEISFIPYQNKSYVAMKLEQPTTFVTFKYVAYDYTAGRWIEKDKNIIRVEIDGQTQWLFLDRWRRLELGVSAGGRASHQLESGMYFAPNNSNGEMDKLRQQIINEINENNFEKLGWFRKDALGHFTIRNGKVKIQRMHFAKVENCKDQKSQSFLDAHHYVDFNDPENPERFALEASVERIYPWIEKVRVTDGSRRHVVVTHSEGTNVEVALQLHEETYSLSFVHDFSKMDDFSGTVIVDFKSNRFFNLTVYNATGIIHGTVKKTADKNSIDEFHFTTYIGDVRGANKTLIVPLPALIDGGDRMICLHADNDNSSEEEICRIIVFKEVALELQINLLENTWKEIDGHCPECNKLTVGGFLSNFNPVNWANDVPFVFRRVVALVRQGVNQRILNTVKTAIKC
ncbi:Type I membrane glycoproteins cell-cell fusogen family protein [Acanthocheilonema viteae]